MNKENTDKLFDTFTFFKPNGSKDKTLMGWGFTCDDGWFNLVWQLCEDIANMEMPEGFEVVQVKEKLGGLRFYCDNASLEIHIRIHLAETESIETCEICGDFGRRRTEVWAKTRCEKHCEIKK